MCVLVNWPLSRNAQFLKLRLKHEGAKLAEQDPKGCDRSTRYRLRKGT